MTEENEVNRIDIILLIQAYNKKEISFEEFLRLTKAWAEAMRRKYETQKQAAQD